jgi:hypothetical protein
MMDKIAALVAQRDQAARAHDRETVDRVTKQLADLANQATTPAQRAAKRVLNPGAKR